MWSRCRADERDSEIGCPPHHCRACRVVGCLMGYGVLSMSHGVICLAWHPLLLRKVYTVQGVAQTLKTGNHAGRTKGKRTKNMG